MPQQPPGNLISDEAAAQIAKIVQEETRKTRNTGPHRARWQYQGGSGQIRHGIVNAVDSCGYYKIELATWNGDADTIGAGLGSGGSGAGDCDLCYDITGAGTSACAITLSYPASQLTGTGDIVTAYDPQSGLIPLVSGSDVLLVNLGDKNGETEVWQILRGIQEHIVEYKERWDCCEPDGPETLLGKTPVILIGKECDEILCEECPASGS